MAAVLAIAAATGGLFAQESDRSRTLGSFLQQVGHRYTAAEGLPSNDVLAIAVAPSGAVVAGTSDGLAVLGPTQDAGPRLWSAFPPFAGRPIHQLAIAGNRLFVLSGDQVLLTTLAASAPPGDEVRPLLRRTGLSEIAATSCASCPEGVVLWLNTPDAILAVSAEAGGPRFLRTLPKQRRHRLATRSSTPTRRDSAALPSDPGPSPEHPEPAEPLAVVGSDGGFLLDANEPRGAMETLPSPPLRPPLRLRAATFSPSGALWFADANELATLHPQSGTWTLQGVDKGLPVADFTSLAADGAGGVWAGTGRGLVHRTESGWEYRQGPRWLPDDRVRDVAVDELGGVWAATAGGVGHIELLPMTLRAKAEHFRREIDRYHRRTPYGYVDAVRLSAPGDLSATEQRDSDNDGLWTAMYGAAECYAYAVTGDPGAKERAAAAFRALRFLGEATQGGDPPALPGFVARSILPAEGPDPNVGLAERDSERQRTRDRKWKLLTPRWPKSADGRWYWKADTSSDELDGHFFFYALYYDLVADEEEKERVRETVISIVDHLIAHDFALVDHDGRPTRWAVFGPQALNGDPDWWEERGLNSMSILSYLRVAEHMSSDPRYGAVAQTLLDDHAYAANVRVPKIQDGPGSGNQSDDEMAFMGFYNLIRYERDPELKSLWAHSFWRYHKLVAPERNPLFNLLYAAVGTGETGTERYRDAFEDLALAPEPGWLDDAVDSLLRYPLDRVSWPLRNSHRLDVVPLDGSEPGRARGYLRSGRVLPIDERFVNHWNHDPWQLDYDGDGRTLADGASFLLPYYLGLYHGFLIEEGDSTATTPKPPSLPP